YVQLLIASAVRAWKSQAERLRAVNADLAVANRHLADQQAWLDAVFAHLPVGVYVIDKDETALRSVNRFVTIPGFGERLLNHPPTKLERRIPDSTQGEASVPADEWPILRALRRGEV